jgi:uncharacterized protein
VIDTFHFEPLREDARRNRYNLKRSSFGSLYKNRTEELFFLYQVNDQVWAIEQNKANLERTFTSFEEGESFLKRNYEAWLVRDDAFVNYLMDQLRNEREDEKNE